MKQDRNEADLFCRTDNLYNIIHHLLPLYSLAENPCTENKCNQLPIACLPRSVKDLAVSFRQLYLLKTKRCSIH